MSNLARFLKDEAGVTAIEYALIAGGIALALVVVLSNRAHREKSRHLPNHLSSDILFDTR